MNRRDLLKLCAAGSVAAMQITEVFSSEPEKPLSMWSNDSDYVIASSLKEAKTIVGLCMFGFNTEPARALEQYEAFERGEQMEDEWFEVDPASEFTFVHNDDTRERKTIGEFTARFGRGYFASADY